MRMFIKKLKNKFIIRFSLYFFLSFLFALLSIYLLLQAYYYLFILFFLFYLFFSYLIYLELKRIILFLKWISEFDYERELPQPVLKKKDEILDLILKFKDKLKEEERLLREKRILEEYRSSFLSRITHEFLSPISVIKGYLTLLIKEEMDFKKLDYIEKVLRNVTRLEFLINSFVVSSREGFYPREFEFKVFDFSELIFEIYESYLPIAQNKNINLVIKLPPFPNTVIGDLEALKSAISNLVDNAIKFTDSKGKVTIEAIKEDNNIKFMVKDTGIGIKKEEIPFIFKPYFQSKYARTKKAGFGLGLTIAKEIVEAHGSELYVESEPGKGTTFYFYLPLKT